MTTKSIQIEICKHLNLIYNHLDKINQLNNLLKDESKPLKELDDSNLIVGTFTIADNDDNTYSL